MENRRDCIAMILAGGKGSRLGLLTKHMAKPAVPFGGKYRIIDFTLSNCTNSGIYNVGVLTQYQPLALHNHIGIGKPWDLDRKNEGVTILSPYMDNRGGSWYQGTASTLYQNMAYIDSLNPENVLVLSADHIYKMDYSEMLKFHKAMQADATISAIEVSMNEASRFGILNVNEDGSIYEFEEKPQKPKSNLASMGIYIFKWDVLRGYIISDAEDPDSSNDFGKDILPKMLNDYRRMYSYRFEGYWKDVGTIESLWQANMDLLADVPELDLHDENWKIYSSDITFPPNYTGKDCIVKASLVNEGCDIYGDVQNSVVFQGVKIGENSIVRDSLIFPNVKIGKNVTIKKAIIGENTVIGDGVTIDKETIQSVSEAHKVSDGYEVSDTGIVVIEENRRIEG